MPPLVSAKQIRGFLSSSLIVVLETMAGVKCEKRGHKSYSGKQVLSPEASPGKEGSTRMFAGSVGFAGKLNGVCYLFLGDNFAYHISSIITGIELDDLDDDTVRDVCGELTNMFAGTFKNALADLGLPSTLTIPTVMQGKRMVISTAGTSSQTRFLFEVDGFSVHADLLLSEI